jgi:hypothetical protein
VKLLTGDSLANAQDEFSAPTGSDLPQVALEAQTVQAELQIVAGD